MDIIKDILSYWGKFFITIILPVILIILAIVLFFGWFGGSGIFGGQGFIEYTSY